MPRIARVRITDTVSIGGPDPVLIMGPCVIESEAHAMKMARIVKRAAARVGLPVIFKASFDKANRSSIASPRGPGLEAGLAVLAKIRQATGMPVTTDIHETSQVGPAAEVVDLLQVPAFLCRQTDLIVACARSGRATTVKKGQFLAPEDCGNIIDKFREAGGRKLAIIERGSSFGYRNLVTDFRSLAIVRSLGVPVIFDATHSVQQPGGLGHASGGAAHFAPLLMRAAMAVGCEGVFMETHDDPAQALSDGPNAIPSKQLGPVLADIRRIHDALGRRPPPKPFV